MAYMPQFTEDEKKFHSKMFQGAPCGLAKTDPELAERWNNITFDEVVNQVDLDDTTRYLGWLATLLGCQGEDEFRIMAGAALNCGLTPVQIREVVYQSIAYLGMGRVYPFIKIMNEVFTSRGIELPLPEQAQTKPDKESRLAGGEEAQVEPLSERFRDFKDKGNPDYPWINVWLVDDCFGNYYARDGLDKKQREIVAFCYIAAQGGCEV